MQDINDFLEPMDHEMREHNALSINRKAYKIDGNNGVKLACKLGGLKSVDYFENNDGKGFLFVEFSDLIKQDKQIKETMEIIKQTNLPKKLNAEIRKDYQNDIQRELVNKFKDSTLIKNNISKYLINIPDEFLELPSYIIVIAPLDKSDQSKLIDAIRFKEHTENIINQKLSDELVKGVKIISLDVFCSQNQP